MTTVEPTAPAAATSMRTGLCGTLGARATWARWSACAAGWPGGASTASTWPSSTCGTTPASSSAWSTARSTSAASTWWPSRARSGDRPEGTVNDRLATGEVEVGDCRVEVLSVAEPPPFAVDDRTDADEPVRLRYRYVDLRRPRMQANLRLRARINAAIRRSMDAQGFCEVETPLLWAPTPEGAREFAVPSRLHQGSFYVLPQSPQLAKQLLMVGGIDRYYQIARCLRDEDLRADRQFEFTQLDMEASFVGQEDVLDFVSTAVLAAAEAATGERPAPIERMTWAEALDRFGTDKPDLRFGMELVDLSDLFAGTEVRAFSAPCVKALVLAGGSGLSRARLDALTERAKALGAQGLAWFRVTDGPGPSTRRSTGSCPTPSARAWSRPPGPCRATSCWSWPTSTGWPARCWGRCGPSSGAGRSARARYRYVWVVDFPLFDGLDAVGQPGAGPPPVHHAPPRRPRAPGVRPRCRSAPRPTTWCSTGGSSGRAASGSTAGDIQRRIFTRAGHHRGGGRDPLRVPARGVPLRGPAPRRLRLRHRPAGGHLRRRGEHPRGHRLPQDPVGRRPADRGAQAAGRRRPWPSLGIRRDPARLRPDRREPGRRPVRRGGRASAWSSRLRWPPGCGPGPSTRWWANATWWPPGPRCGSWSSRTGWARSSCGDRRGPARRPWPACWPTPRPRPSSRCPR